MASNNCCGITCCAGKSILGLVGIILANIFYWLGAGLIWGGIYEQVPSEYHFHGAFNAACYYVLQILFVFTIPFSVAGLVKAGWLNNTKLSAALAAICYVGIGWGMAVQSGSVGLPGGGPLEWASFSVANLQNIRIQWEETQRLCKSVDEGEYDACKVASEAFYYGFSRPSDIQNLGLGNQMGVVSQFTDSEGVPNSANSANSDDLRVVFAGLIIAFISGYTLFALASGPNQGVPFAGPVGSAEWTPGYQSSVFTSLIAFAFGLTATFVLWSTDAAADPTHPFYENVLNSAASVFLVTFLCLLGVVSEESQWLEASLFFAGFLTLAAPVRMWQMKALASTNDIAPYMSSNMYKENTIAREAEVDRYLIGGSLTIIATVFVLYTACKALAADAKAVAMAGTVTTSSPVLRSLRAALLGFSFIGIWTAVGMLWSQTNDALEKIDATDSDRGNAAHYYIFLLLFAYFGWFVNGLDAVFSGGAPAEDGAASVTAKIPFGALKPLMWVSTGLVAATFTGYVSVGTHDRQLWHIDASLANANEVREIVTHTHKPSRSYGADHEDYQVTFTALVILFITICSVAMTAVSFPFTVRTSVPTSGCTTFGFLTAAISFVFFIVGFCVLLSTPMAHPMVANDTVADGKFDVADRVVAGRGGRVVGPLGDDDDDYDTYAIRFGESLLTGTNNFGFGPGGPDDDDATLKPKYNLKNIKIDYGCSGKFYNMYLDQATVKNQGDYCFKSVKYWEENWENPLFDEDDEDDYTVTRSKAVKRFTSERFTVNMFNPDPVNNYVSSTYMQLFTISALALVAAYQNFFGIASGSTIMVKSSLYVFGFIIVTVGYAMNWQGADKIGQNGSIWDDEQCDEDGEGDCRSFKAGFAFFFLQAIFGIIAGAYIIGGQFIAHNVLNEDPQGVACCACLPCCKSSGSGAEEIEMTETADESRDAVTGI